MTGRRDFVIASSALFGCAALDGWLRPVAAVPLRLNDEFARIERESGGRLGVAMLDTHTNARAGHRTDERFPMCSTFKLLACGAVLKRVERKEERLDRRIPVEAADIVPESSHIKAPVADGLSVSQLCEAAMTYSDNTAANLILKSLGGPQAVTAYARAIGDHVTRLDRIEPELNEALPGDMRDTTTPAVMLGDMRRLVLGDALSESSKALLTQWLIGNKTGDTRLRAGLPKDWRVGDKTGTGERGSANDIAVVWPQNRAPLIVTAYLTGTQASADARNATHADVARAIVAAMRE
jgi:beta-lactamase class A